MPLPLSILVIDDEVDLSLLLKQFLSGLGFNAVSFTDPLLAFEHLKYNQKNYSLIIVDLRMPGMSGLDLANKIRKEINAIVKIFLITAFDISDMSDWPSFQSAKFERIIQKPIKLSTLKKVISQTIEQIQTNIKNQGDVLDK
jgi:CheY-like chemotaxis protein